MGSPREGNLSKGRPWREDRLSAVEAAGNVRGAARAAAEGGGNRHSATRFDPKIRAMIAQTLSIVRKAGAFRFNLGSPATLLNILERWKLSPLTWARPLEL
jgi:hypothetical protein